MLLYRFICFCGLIGILSFSRPVEMQALNDVSPFVELVGNPFTARFPAGDLVYARNVWDMEVFDNRLYLGHGNSDNEGPAPNAGPVEIWSYDAITNQFNAEFTVSEEEIEHFVVIDGQLYIPGHDTTEAWGTGNFYRLEQSGWQKYRTIPGALHVYDIAGFKGQLFAALGIAEENSYVVDVSNDKGLTWDRLQVPSFQVPNIVEGTQRAWELFDFGNHLYVNVAPGTYTADAPKGSNAYLKLSTSEVVEFNGTNSFNLLNNAFFAPYYASDSYAFVFRRIARPVTFLGQLVYIGAHVVTDHSWQSFGLFSSNIMNDKSMNDDFEPETNFWDTLVSGNILYVLTSKGTTVSVQSTCDLVHWREVLRFDAPTFARSFALYQGDFYFGLGSSPQQISPATGNILRVDSEHFNANCD